MGAPAFHAVVQFNREHFDFREPLINVGRVENFFFGTFDVNLEQINFVEAGLRQKFRNRRRPKSVGVVSRRLERHEIADTVPFRLHVNESFLVPQRGFYRVNVVVKRRVELEQLEVGFFGLDGINLRVGVFVGKINRRTADVPAAVQNQFRLKIFNRQNIFLLLKDLIKNPRVAVTAGERRRNSINSDDFYRERCFKLIRGGWLVFQTY